MWYAECRYHKQKESKRSIENEAIVEDRTDLLVVCFTISASDKDLSTLAKSKSNHINGKIKHAANGRCTQFYFANTTQKCCVGDIYDVLGDERQENRISYVENVFVRSHNG